MKRCRLPLCWAALSCGLCLFGSVLTASSQVIDPPITPPLRPVVSIAVVDAEGAEPERIPPGMLRPIVLNPLVFVVSRLGPVDFDLPIFYRLSGSAENGSDYERLSGLITIPKGSTSVRLSVMPLDDDRAESTETVVVALEYPICPAIFPPPRECYLVGQPAVAQGTILDNGAVTDGFPPQVSVVAADAVAREPRTPLPNERLLLDRGQFRIARTGSTTAPLRVFYSLSGTALNGSDYQALRSAIVIPEGASTIDLDVTPINDGVVESPESVVLTLIDPLTLPEPAEVGLPGIDLGGVLWASYEVGAPAVAEVELLDNGEGKPVNLPVVSISTLDDVATEPSSADPDILRVDKAYAVVSRTAPFDAPLSVMYRLGGSAVNGVDYGRLAYTATIPAGSKSTLLEVVPLYDRLLEEDESVVVTLVRWPISLPPDPLVLGSNPDDLILPPIDPPVLIPRYELGTDYAAKVQIRDNGLAPENRPPKADIVSPARGSEFEAPASFDIVVQTADADGYVPWVEFFLGKEKIGDSRIDFIKAPEPGALITHTFRWENVAEGSYGITSVAHDNGGATTLTAEISIRVVSDLRPTVSILARDAIATEGSSEWATPTATFLIRRQGPMDDELSVGLKIGGSAVPAKDYATLPEKVVIPAGVGSVRLVVRPTDDQEVERIETVSIELLPADSGLVKPGIGWPAYRLGRPAQGVVVILDNDQSRPPCQLLPDGLFHLCLPGNRGLGYRLEVSPDLTNWNDLGPVSAEDGAVHYVDPEVEGVSRRFYRLQTLSLDEAPVND
ncbi:MAG: hypothetical protein JNN07_03345 [Verrucomicrobiales bacterium]|nr:hypothetical protein [Verrucomicrobiales bacterium]